MAGILRFLIKPCSGAATLSIMTHNVTTLSIIGLIVTHIGNWLLPLFIVKMCGFMPNVIMVSAIMLNVITLSAIIMSFIKCSALMLSVITLRIIIM